MIASVVLGPSVNCANSGTEQMAKLGGSGVRQCCRAMFKAPPEDDASEVAVKNEEDHPVDDKAKIPMESIVVALKGNENENSHDALRVLDIILRQHAVAVKNEEDHPVDGKGIRRKVIDKLYQTYDIELTKRDFVYDSPFVPFLKIAGNGNRDSNSPDENDGKRARRLHHTKTFKVLLSFAAKIPMESIAVALKGNENENSRDALRVLDIILRQYAVKGECFFVRQSFFQNNSNNFPDIGGGVTGCSGFHSSFRTSQGGLSLNIRMVLANHSKFKFSTLNWIKLLRYACKFLDEQWCPKFTLIIAQKNHHTKFFLPNSPDNVQPGTIVDNQICHLRNYGFYMCSHAGMILGLSFKKAIQWWEKGLLPNMKEIESAEDLANSLLNAGDQLVVVDFFSPGCGGCRALHPKICQIAGLNPDVSFLQINYELHKGASVASAAPMQLFFWLKTDQEVQRCITDRCSLGPARGLEKEELLALAASKDLSFDYPSNPVPFLDEVAERTASALPLPVFAQDADNKALALALAVAGR
ncbi:hypothetical protein ZIOFF_013207 [Zingiber officinale]|uniref:Argonaute linker 1 domain-containing protein n=1 Tax=Zingiber officinale TaxID=94328 RepID=A0A8J5LU11_ZINOF|nr:hypothetical protein ZIOFF_013207 [Zingiber officinale]